MSESYEPVNKDSNYSTQRSAEEILYAIAAGTSMVVGDDFFNLLVQHLADALNVRYAFVIEHLDDPPTKALALATWMGDHIQQPFLYNLAKTPCEMVAKGIPTYFPQDLQKKFPKDNYLVDLNVESYCGLPLRSASDRIIGHLSVMDVKPMTQNLCDCPAYQIIAARASAELDRKATDAELKKKHSLLNAIVEGTSDAIAVTDTEGRYIFINSAGTSWLGKPVEKLIGQPELEMFPPDIAQKIKDDDEKLLTSGEQHSFENTISFGGDTRSYLANKTIYRDHQGNIIGLIGIARDITELKQAQKELHEVEENLRRVERLASIGTLAAGIAHELNNPLGLISLYTDIGLHSLDDITKLEQSFRDIDNQVLRCTRIIDSVLRIARNQTSEKWRHNLNGTIRQAIYLTRQYLSDYRIEIIEELDKNLPLILMNPLEMELVIVNLIHNAAQASHENKKILICTQQKSESIQLLIQDWGCGMNEAQLTQAFEPLYTTRRNEEGTGLGLSICRTIVVDHGGSIDIESQYHSGTTIKIEFPIN